MQVSHHQSGMGGDESWRRDISELSELRARSPSPRTVASSYGVASPPHSPVAGGSPREPGVHKAQALAVVSLLATLWICGTAVFLDLSVRAVHSLWADESLPTMPCIPDKEGQWSIGIYRGASPFDLRPLEDLGPSKHSSNSIHSASTQHGSIRGMRTAGARPDFTVANPAFTCAHVTDMPASFVADPFLWPMQDGSGIVYMFFEVKSFFGKKGSIGAAESRDGGYTFRHLGVVLEESWHLSYPHVFNYSGQMYMLPEGSANGALLLYRATNFPTHWQLDSQLLDQPLVDASLLAPRPGSDGRWYMFASNRNNKRSSRCRELEIWASPSPKGPWQLHPSSPVRIDQQGSRMAGPPIVHEGQLYRFGQECAFTYGHRVRVFHITTLNATHYAETEVHLPPGLGVSPKGRAAWNGVRQHHLDAHQLPDGTWLAAMDGDRVVSDYTVFEWLERLTVLLPVSIILGLASFFLHAWGGWRAVFAPLLLLFWVMQRTCCCCCNFGLLAHVILFMPRAVRRRLAARRQRLMAAKGECVSPSSRISYLDHNDAKDQYKKAYLPRTVRDAYSLLARGKKAATGSWRRKMHITSHLGAAAFTGPAFLNRRKFLGVTIWRWLVSLVLLCLGALLVLYVTWAYFKMEVLSFVVWYINVFGGHAAPIPVNGYYSKFSMLVMSYETRLLPLQAFVKHYSRCPSVGEIVVVWNKGAPPDPLAFDSGVPVRVRVEPENSMNNRFKADPQLKHRGVMLLDDDILLSCADIEYGFARWRQYPERITGLYARLLEGEIPNYHCKHCERHTYKAGRYNVVLAGASFMDSQLVFQAYSSLGNQMGRDYVDRVFNCDDLLVNYIMAQQLSGLQHAQWVRPRKRVDVGRLTSSRLSGGRDVEAIRHQCTQDFAAMFGNPLKGRAYPLDFMGLRKPTCLGYLGCMYI